MLYALMQYSHLNELLSLDPKKKSFPLFKLLTVE